MYYMKIKLRYQCLLCGAEFASCKCEHRKNKMNEVELFLTKHMACSDCKNWAVENCKTMQEVWDTAKPGWLLWLATREGVSSKKDLHRFSCWAVRQVWHLLKDERSRKAIDVKERWIEGKASDEELAAAMDAAMDAARTDARDAQAKWIRENIKPVFVLEH